MKKFLLIIISITTLFAKTSQIEITADKFKADENKHQTTFTGHVKVTKELDKINSSIMLVVFDKDNKPLTYNATENVSFFISLKDSTIQGSCQKLTYVPKSKLYTFEDNVDLLQLPSNRKIKASKVIIDVNKNQIDIAGQKNKPIKFIFETEENDKNN